MHYIRSLPKRVTAVLQAAVVVVVAGSAVAVASSFQSVPRKSTIVLVPTATPSPTAIATPSPMPTPRPTPTPTPRPAPTATPFPTGPNPPGNWMSVTVDRSAGCQPVNGSPKAYPTLYLTNTYPNRGYILKWSYSLSSPYFFLESNEGGELEGRQTATILVAPPYNKPVGSLAVSIFSYSYPYSDVQGQWQGTLQPCY